MPRKYKRKAGVQARVVSWTVDKLQPAFNEMDKGIMGINEISRLFGIPSRTLRRRYAAQNKTQLTLGKHPVLGFQNEKRLVNHILKLVDAGFPPNRHTICTLAYQFAEKLKPKHKFDNEKQSAGNNYVKVSEGRGVQKRQSIYSSSSDGGDYPLINYKTKGKKTKGLPVKKTNKDKQESFEDRNEIKSSRKRHIILSSNSETEDKLGTYSKMIEEKCKDLSVKKNKREKQGSSKHTDENNCIECFDSYENTKSKSDWIQCISCQKWLHETCTLFKNYCSRCGKERL